MATLLLWAAVLVGGLPGRSWAALVVTDLQNGVTATDLVQALLGPGVVASNVTFSGVDVAAGTFVGGIDPVGFNRGIVLSSGRADAAVGPNDLDSTTTELGVGGDPDLDALVPGFSTLDATVLEFDFVPTTGQVEFQYAFASEEYNEFVGSTFNDVFGFFVNGANRALLPDDVTVVSINNVNGGDPFGTGAANPDFYVNNDCNDGGCPIDAEFDGRTIVLTLTASVTPNESNHIKLAIADAGDDALDSWVFIRAESLTSTEVCDNGVDDDGDDLVDGADPDCHFCGDGITDPDEQCDDGNSVSGDGCSLSCQLEQCGNEAVDTGEECDDGNNVSGDGCQADCQFPECGDEVVDAGEQCDDGDTEPGDGCRADCTVEVCGDGTADPQEECDDGNVAEGDGCSSTCETEDGEAFCGDGSVNQESEECDDGNVVDGDGCSAACAVEACGDGVVQEGFGEECDDGNVVDGDGCSAACAVEACGDGVVQEGLGEECDDGNVVDGDGCSAACAEEQDLCTELCSKPGAIHVAASNVILVGSAGDDVLCGDDRANTLRGNGGEDVLCGFGGNDLLIGHSGPEYLDGGDGNDVLRGESGADTLLGGRGDDSVFGHGGSDLILAGPGNDHVRAGAGNDSVDGGEDVDVINGDGGVDACIAGESLLNCE